MSFRTIVIKSRSKLELSINYMVCRKVDEEIKINLDEIKTIIINTLQVSITTALIQEIIRKKIKLIFTDDKHNPIGEVMPYNNNYYTYRKIKEQLAFDVSSKSLLWKEIIKRKILNQANNLNKIGKTESYSRLCLYMNDVQDNDSSNREGHAAKVYFNSLFGNNFSRKNDCQENTYLNYGYSIILSSINREIKSFGYLTELGIHHIGDSNPFNLSCDFIEPLRPFVDSYVIQKIVNDENYKDEYIKMLISEVEYNGKKIILENAIHLYVEDLLNYLKTGDYSKIKFIDYEL